MKNDCAGTSKAPASEASRMRQLADDLAKFQVTSSKFQAGKYPLELILGEFDDR
jgi:hypothetical protein